MIDVLRGRKCGDVSGLFLSLSPIHVTYLSAWQAPFRFGDSGAAFSSFLYGRRVARGPSPSLTHVKNGTEPSSTLVSAFKANSSFEALNLKSCCQVPDWRRSEEYSTTDRNFFNYLRASFFAFLYNNRNGEVAPRTCGGERGRVQ